MTQNLQGQDTTGTIRTLLQLALTGMLPTYSVLRVHSLIIMAVFLRVQNNQSNNRHHVIHRPRVLRDRIHPLDAYDDQEIIDRYRLSRELIMELCDLLDDRLRPGSNRNHAIPSCLHLFCELRFYATGSFQADVGDNEGV